MKDITEEDLRRNIPLAASKRDGTRSLVSLGDHQFGGEEVIVIAGPCVVESHEQTLDIARHVQAAGAVALRGGAFKPLTFPYRTEKVYELREKGLEILRDVRSKCRIPIVTEITDLRFLDVMCKSADMLQIGARNMQNFPLLEEVGKAKIPVLLKRHFGASLRDWLGAAEYLLYHGNCNVVLCERGIVAPHTHQQTSRFIVDLQVIPAAREYTHLPIILDASHATFRRQYVAPVARAAIAAGADGVMVDVHPDPENAAVDPLQALSYGAFRELMDELRGIAKVLGKRVAEPPHS